MDFVIKGNAALVQSYHLGEWGDIPVMVRLVWDDFYMGEPLKEKLGEETAQDAFEALASAWGFDDASSLYLNEDEANIYYISIYKESTSSLRKLTDYCKAQLVHASGDDSYFDYYPGLLEFLEDYCKIADIIYPGNDYIRYWREAIEYAYIEDYWKLEPETIVPQDLLPVFEAKRLQLMESN